MARRVEGEGPGAAVGIDIVAPPAARSQSRSAATPRSCPAAMASVGSRRRDHRRDRALPRACAVRFLLDLRGRAERQLARPVTHAVIAAEPARRLARQPSRRAAVGRRHRRPAPRRARPPRRTRTGAARGEAAVLGAAHRGRGPGAAAAAIL